MAIEKRKYPRVKLNLKIIVSDAEGKYLNDPLAKIFNLSLGGARLQSRINFNKGEKVSLLFACKKQYLKVIGIVLWKEKGEYVSVYRVSFLNLNFFKKIILKRFIRLYLGKASTFIDKSLVFWEIIFLVLLMYLLGKACALLPLGFVLIVIVVVVLSFYFWLSIKEKKDKFKKRN